MNSDRAKVLHEVAGRPLILWAVEAARAAGAGRVVTILGYQHDRVRALLDRRYGEGAIDVALQVEQRGTAHAVQSALPALVDEPDDRIVVIVTGDAPLFAGEQVRALIDACAGSASGMALAGTTPPYEMPYGRLVRDVEGRLLRIVEHRDATDAERSITEVNAGFYAIRLGHLRRDIAALTSDNAQNELYLTDLAAAAAARGGAATVEVDFADVHGINDRRDLARVDVEARRRINDAWLAAGVTMVAPAQVFVDADVGPIGRDVTLAPGVCLRGTTRVGAGTHIDLGCVLTDVVVADNAYLKPHCVLTDTEIGERSQIGPFTHCRPGTRVDEDAKVGNFVETKKTHLMAGAKASHLSYLGDTSVGAGANIGAGTITCNYDGVMKHRTVIEAGAFIGSDTQLVAPVTVGRDAYVGAGTTVTKDVPRGGLALSRVKQVNIDGWADRFREAMSKRRRRTDDGGSQST
jgi:bifunctional UDP-N-acetylglucosamine pyrophosphorylase/glucosamine-1-phosphate N-acetyltransferase